MNKDTAVMRAVRTAIQTLAGVVLGLFTTVWAVPGVPDAVLTYLASNALVIGTAFGVPAGIVAFAWNYFRKDVRTV
jgi:hypothetical protein